MVHGISMQMAQQGLYNNGMYNQHHQHQCEQDGVLETLYQHHLSQALAGISKKKNSKVVQVEFNQHSSASSPVMAVPTSASSSTSVSPVSMVIQHQHNGSANTSPNGSQLYVSPFAQVQQAPQQQISSHNFYAVQPQQQQVLQPQQTQLQGRSNSSSLLFDSFFQEIASVPQQHQQQQQQQQIGYNNHLNNFHGMVDAQLVQEDDDENDDDMAGSASNSPRDNKAALTKAAVEQYLAQNLVLKNNLNIANNCQMTESQKRANFACSECRKSHKACSGGRPCERCVKLGMSECCRDISRKKRHVTKKHWHKFMNGSNDIKEQIIKVQQEFVHNQQQVGGHCGRRGSIEASV